MARRVSVRCGQLQDAHLAASEALLADGTVTIEELPDIDLAIVRIPPQLAPRPVRRYLEDEQAAVHPFASEQRDPLHAICCAYRATLRV